MVRWEKILCILGWLVAHRFLPDNPASVTRPMDPLDEKPRRPARALSPAECDSLVVSARCPVRGCLYLFRWLTGLRVSEAARVQWSDIDLGDSLLTMPGRRDGQLNTKTKRDAVIPLATELCDALADLQRAAFRRGEPAQPADRVFAGAVSMETFDHDLKRAGIAREVDGRSATPKSLRRSFDSHLLMAGCDPMDTLLLMRHSLPQGMDLTLGVYADPAALLFRKRAAIGRLTAWIADQRQGVATRHGATTG